MLVLSRNEFKFDYYTFRVLNSNYSFCQNNESNLKIDLKPQQTLGILDNLSKSKQLDKVTAPGIQEVLGPIASTKDRQADRQADRQMDRQAEREIREGERRILEIYYVISKYTTS